VTRRRRRIEMERGREAGKEEEFIGGDVYKRERRREKRQREREERTCMQKRDRPEVRE